MLGSPTACVVMRMLVVLIRLLLVQHRQTLVIASFGIKAGLMELFATEIVRVVLTLDALQSPSMEA